MIVNNVCVSVSLYFIVLFYQLSKQALKPYHPLLKFSVIKGIVFFCYWYASYFIFQKIQYKEKIFALFVAFFVSFLNNHKYSFITLFRQSIIFAAIVWIPFVRFRDWNREHIAYTLQVIFKTQF